MKCLTLCVALIASSSLLCSTQGFMLKKATKALGGYVLVKALEPKPPKMVGIMMPMPMMQPMAMAMAKPMMDDKPSPAAMMAMMNAMMMMDNNKKPAMKEPVMQMEMPSAGMMQPAMPSNDMMKMMGTAAEKPMNMNSMMATMMMMNNGMQGMQMEPMAEPSNRQVLAAVDAFERGRHHEIPRDIHVH